MELPKIIIFFLGGTHGDFLYSCGQLMLGKEKNVIANNGRVLVESTFKKTNLQSYNKGSKVPYKITIDNQIEICHIWQEEFKNLVGKFYYIDFDVRQLNVIKKMFLKKVHDNNLHDAIQDFVKYLPESVAKKITVENFEGTLLSSYKNAIKKYKKQPGIKPIKMTDLYNFDKLVEILKDMQLFDTTKLKDLKNFHDKWKDRNKVYIKKLLQET